MSVPLSNMMPAPVTGRIDFGWIGQAWALFSAQAGVWVAAILLYFLLYLALWVMLAIPTGVMTSMHRVFAAVLAHTTPVGTTNPYRDFTQNHALGILLAGIGEILTGGLYRMALGQRRGESISVAGLFSAFPQALPLLVVGGIVPTALGVVDTLILWGLHFFLPAAAAVAAVNFVAWLPALILPGLLMFAPLLVIDTGASAVDALLGSFRLIRSQWLMAVVFYVVVSLLGTAGALFCGIGSLVTYPLFIVSIAVGYLALTQPAADLPLGYDAPPDAGVWPPPPRVQ